MPPEDQTVYFWIIPAKVEGTWKVTMPATDGKSADGTLELKQSFQKVTGTANVGGKKHEIKDGVLRGAEFTFSIPGAGAKDKPVKHTVTVDGDSMKGKDASFTGKRTGGGGAKEAPKKDKDAEKKPADAKE